MRTSDEVRAAGLAYLKSKTVITSLLSSSGDIKEAQWQGVDFVYPAIRLSLDFLPSINGCGPDKAEFTIETFSEEKSSLQAETISAAMETLLHKHPFSVTIQLPNQSPKTIKFPIVVVTKVLKAERSIYGWRSQINLTTQVV
ncbi:MAG TPA: hypothetical protein VIY48_16450 [Candidatus Paceibacterota bacterium]